MARKKKKKPKGEGTDPAPPKAPERISRPFADALRNMTVAEVAPPEPPPPKGPAASPKKKAAGGDAAPKSDEAYSYEDRAAFNAAFANVAPLGAKKAGKAQKTASAPAQRVAPASTAIADDSARARLASLVADGLRFTVRREDDWIEGVRDDAPKGRLLDLRHGRASSEAEIDLHGMTGDAAVASLVRFLKQERSRGHTIVRVIHGKGLHSSGGVGVLGDRVVDAITGGPAAPLTHAFVTAGRDAGGSGALLLRLENR